jgi:hypothetical protein
VRRKPFHPDAESIADDGGDENREHQRPAAKVVIEVHRMSTVSGLSSGPHGEGKAEERKLGALLLVLDVTYDGVAYMGDKVIERPDFFLARVRDFALSFWSDFHSGGFAYFRDCHWIHSLQRFLLNRHPLGRFVAALRALIENRVFPAIERRLDSVDMHGLKDVAGQAMDERGKQVDHVRE